MQEFVINRGSVNPVLEMEVIDDGRYSFHKSLINEALQGCEVTFSMVNEETGIFKITRAKANVVEAYDAGCEEKYILQYKWTEKDTKYCGTYKGWFDIKFSETLASSEKEYPKGTLRVPIEEDLRIIIK